MKAVRADAGVLNHWNVTSQTRFVRAADAALSSAAAVALVVMVATATAEDSSRTREGPGRYECNGRRWRG